MAKYNGLTVSHSEYAGSKKRQNPTPQEFHKALEKYFQRELQVRHYESIARQYGNTVELEYNQQYQTWTVKEIYSAKAVAS